MQFKNPEVLYFLFSLIIPVLVHLFQLKKFKIQEFSNVAFLKEISLQTRKSSQLKKWLLLVCRLFLLSAVIFAFAQPYFPSKNQNSTSESLIIALDNSFSMQAKGENGAHLPNAIQQILEQINSEKTFSLLTNNQSYWDIDIKSAQNDIQKIGYTSTPFNLQNTLNKIQAKNSNQEFDLLVISDANFKIKDSVNTLKKLPFLIKTETVNKQNIAIQDVKLNDNLTNFNELQISLKGYLVKDSLEVVLTVLENDKIISKSKIWVNNSGKVVNVNLPKQSINGIVIIEDNNLSFDNQYYFTIKANNLTKIGILGRKAPFIQKIYPKQNTTLQYINEQNDLSEFDAIIVNEIETNFASIGKKLKKIYDQGAQIIYIPSEIASIENQNLILKEFANISFISKKDSKASITNIQQTHPVFSNVFEKKPENFEYPTTKFNYVVSGILSPILSFSNQEVFLGNITNGFSNFYLFTSSLNDESSNIINSPIVVPTFYNMAISNNQNTLQNYTIGSGNFMLVDAFTANSKPITIENSDQKVIPLQQPIGNKTKIIFEEVPNISGNYIINQNNKTIDQISLNYNRTESDLSLSDADLFNNFVQVKSIDEVLTQLESNRLGIELWKYFLLTTLLFLILELLIQKFVK